jgi:hypothetical protein
MNACNGDGFCLHQCCCVCFDDEEHEVPSEVCACGHRSHTKQIGGNTELDLYCQESCPHNCTLAKCHNFKLCCQKRPLAILRVNNGMCLNCALAIGKLEFLEEKDDCPICLENKDMVLISCGKHKVCVDCWNTASETENRPIPLSCPLCRESIWKWKGR